MTEITMNDIKRLATEILEKTRDQPFGDWFRDNGLEVGTMSRLNDAVSLATVAAVIRGRNTEQIMFEEFCTVFQLGWEAHKQYGSARSEL